MATSSGGSKRTPWWAIAGARGAGSIFTPTASSPPSPPRDTIPAGTWVFQEPDGAITVCAFPRDTEVQGHLCRGSGGPEGVQTALYADGGLKQFFPQGTVRIDGVPCSASLFEAGIELHPNGRLNLKTAIETDPGDRARRVSYSFLCRRPTEAGGIRLEPAAPVGPAP